MLRLTGRIVSDGGFDCFADNFLRRDAGLDLNLHKWIYYGMTRKRALSTHARALLGALLAARRSWSYGYELASLTGIKSGTLYPLLIRLEAQGFLEAEWQRPVANGRPPRHAYRLTAEGQRLALAEAGPAGHSVSTAGWRAGGATS